jgi:ribosomal protein S21
MALKSGPKYSRESGKEVESEMRRFKRGTARSGKGGKVKSRKQAIAIALSKARKKGERVPKKK